MTDHRTLKPADFDDPYLTPEAARQAPVDAPPATPPCYQMPDGGWRHVWSRDGDGSLCRCGRKMQTEYDGIIVDAPADALPNDYAPVSSTGAAEPPAPPAQVLNAREVHYIRLARLGNLTHRDVVELADSHGALSAEVARLQEERDWYQTRMAEANDTASYALKRSQELEAEAQALRERIAAWLKDVRLPAGTNDATVNELAWERKLDKLAALLSPAQEAP